MRSDHQGPQVVRRRRALLISVATAVMTLLSGLGLPSVASAAVGVPTTYLAPDGTEYASTAPPSADKPQSKLWFQGNSWWALMVGAGSTATSIHELMPDHTWRNTGAVVDSRANNNGDALWSSKDGRLYVASRALGASLQVNAFTFDSTGRSWSRVPGFPVTLNSGGQSESVTIDQDSLGNLWVTYTRASRLWVAHSTDAARTTWTAGFQPNVGDTVLDPDDISAVITFGSRIGIMWSDQESAAFRFATRDVTAADTAPWQVEDALSGTGLADDHINLKQLAEDSQGRIYAAVKTSTEDNPAADPNAAQVGILTRTPGVNGASPDWQFTAAGTVAQGWTRPILMIDRANRDLYFFATTDTGSGGDVVYRRSDLPADPNQGIALGTTQTFMNAARDLNNASGAKDPVDGNTGLVILATSQAVKKYAHAEMALVPGGRFDGGGGGDTTAPTVTSTNPTAGATGVAVGIDVTATLSENVTGVDGSTFTLAPTGGGQAVTAEVSYNSTSRVATLNPSADLSADTSYTATLGSGSGSGTGTAIADGAGNALTPVSWSFRTAAAAPGDTTPPTVTSTSPASNATGVAVGSNVTVTFSENVNGVNGTTFTLAPIAGGTPLGAQVTYDSTTPVATLNPTADLSPSTQYTASLTAGITDSSGNALAPTSWSFTTAAAAAGPVVTNRSPAPNAQSVLPGSNVTATFSTAVQNVNTSTFTLVNAATGAQVAAVVGFNNTSRVATLNPSVNLAADTRYRATLTTGIRDSAGNTLAADESWEFVTGPAPRLTKRSPAVNATGVNVAANVTATFSEQVQNVSTTTFTLTPAAGGPAVTAVVSRKGTTNQWILNPDQNLAGNTKYTASLGSGITDAAGNPLAVTTWSFTTGP